METKMEDIERLSPERLMRMFSRSPVILAWIMAILIHLGLGVATSWEDAWAILRGKPTSWERKAAGDTNAVASVTGTVSSVTGTVTTATGMVSIATGDTNAVVAGTNVTGIATNEPIVGSPAHEAEMLKKYSNSLVVREITAVDTNIPKVVDELGISIKDTDPFNK
jgi:hypothetical protein